MGRPLRGASLRSVHQPIERRYHRPVTQETPSPGSNAYLLNRIIIVVACIGIFIAGTLSYAHVTNSMPPCGPTGPGCGDVLSSKYAYIAGVPVAFIGLAAYIAIAGLSLLRSAKSGSDWSFLVKLTFALSSIGVLASFGFTFLSLVFLGHVCIWCISSAITMIVLFFLHASLWNKEPPSPAASFDSLAGIGGLVLAIVLMVPAVAAFEKGSSAVMKSVDVSKISRESLLPSDSSKVWGDPKAKVVLIEFADVNCPACRSISPQVHKLVKGMPTMAYAFRSLPLFNIPGHETSIQAAMACEFAAEHGKYREMHEKLFEEGNKERVKSVSGIVSIAREIGLDSRALSQLLNGKAEEAVSDKLMEKVTEDFNLAQSYKVSSTPTFILYADGHGAKAMTFSEVERALATEPYLSLLKQ